MLNQHRVFVFLAYALALPFTGAGKNSKRSAPAAQGGAGIRVSWEKSEHGGRQPQRPDVPAQDTRSASASSLTHTRDASRDWRPVLVSPSCEAALLASAHDGHDWRMASQ